VWALMVDGAERALSIHRTQAKATAAAVEMLNYGIGGDLIVKRVNGTTRSSHTIGDSN